jgi:hypothetical protein
MKMIKVTKVKANPNNPRIIKDHQFKKLVNSLKEFPKMMELRPIIVDDEWVIVGGNMRFKALQELGYTEFPNEWVKQAKEFTEQELKEFVIKDNLSFGEWDWDSLGNEWDEVDLNNWGLDVWKQPTEVDYGILDETDISQEISNMSNGVKKAIQIEFDIADFEEAQEVIKYWREKELYIGKYLIDKLKQEKELNV